MNKDQKVVLTGAISGVVAMIVLLWLLYRVLPAPAGAEEAANRIAYAVKWHAFAVLPFFAMVIVVGNARFLSEAIDPTLGKESLAMIINGRVAENTLQQFVLFVTGTLALAAAVEGDTVRIVGAAAIVFFVMRIAFWIGYRIQPVYRAFGFSSCAYMNLGLIGSALYLAAT